MQEEFSEKEKEEIIEWVIKNIGWVCGALEENKGKLFQGGCGEEVTIENAYRCADCTAPFHRKCIFEHFKFPMANKREIEKII